MRKSGDKSWVRQNKQSLSLSVSMTASSGPLGLSALRDSRMRSISRDTYSVVSTLAFAT